MKEYLIPSIAPSRLDSDSNISHSILFNFPRTMPSLHRRNSFFPVSTSGVNCTLRLSISMVRFALERDCVFSHSLYGGEETPKGVSISPPIESRGFAFSFFMAYMRLFVDITAFVRYRTKGETGLRPRIISLNQLNQRLIPLNLHVLGGRNRELALADKRFDSLRQFS